MNRRIAIGYFGKPGSCGGPVHIIKDGRPCCGSKLGPEQEFQWCSWHTWTYVECGRCLRTKVFRKLAEASRLRAEALGLYGKALKQLYCE